MKYMGSKSYMLKNGLGKMIIEQSKNFSRFFDPFCGSGAVSWFAAKNTNNKVIAGDLQKYAKYLTDSVILRDKPLKNKDLFRDWLDKSREIYTQYSVELTYNSDYERVEKSRIFCASATGLITQAYGGHYYSPEQSRKFDLMLELAPQKEPYKSVAIAALIITATKCAAAPGHTAQPFQPTATALRFIIESWDKEPFDMVDKTINDLCTHYATIPGESYVSNAIDLIKQTNKKDLIFIDPPYSGVHYSRFYHVLETIARGKCGNISGKGRYPAPSERPKSDFSLRTNSLKAFDELLSVISNRKATAIVTFPENECSNGLSGDLVKTLSEKYFNVLDQQVSGHFSTLGGNHGNRPARKKSSELILLLSPK